MDVYQKVRYLLLQVQKIVIERNKRNYLLTIVNITIETLYVFGEAQHDHVEVIRNKNFLKVWRY